MNLKTKESTEWRAKQRALGFIPKLIWVQPADWEQVKKLLDKLRAKNLQRKQPKD